MDKETRDILTEIAKSYNDDLETEKLHRDNLRHTLVLCLIWIGAAIIKMLWPERFKDIELIMIAFGASLMVMCMLGIIIINRRYKIKVKQILNARHQCLHIRDSDSDIKL